MQSVAVKHSTIATVAWLPFQLDLYIYIFYDQVTGLSLFNPLQTVACINSCANPVIYALMWRPFRRSLLAVIVLNNTVIICLTTLQSKTTNRVYPPPPVLLHCAIVYSSTVQFRIVWSVWRKYKPNFGMGRHGKLRVTPTLKVHRNLPCM